MAGSTKPGFQCAVLGNLIAQECAELGWGELVCAGERLQAEGVRGRTHWQCAIGQVQQPQ